MAQLLTAPETNPTIRQDLPNQLRDLKPIQNILMCGADPQPSYREIDSINSMQLTFADLAAKDKFTSAWKWQTTDTGLVYSIQVDNNWIRNAFSSITSNRFKFLSYDYVEINVMPTNNSAYAGELAIAWLPIPDANYYDVMYGLDIYSRPELFTQLDNVRFEPNNSNITKIRIPMKCLTKFIYGNVSIGTQPGFEQQNAAKTFLDGITYGYICFYVLTPLKTKSSTLSLSMNYSISIIGAKYGGISST